MLGCGAPIRRGSTLNPHKPAGQQRQDHPHPRSVRAVAISPDELRLFSACGVKVYVRRFDNGHALRKLRIYDNGRAYDQSLVAKSDAFISSLVVSETHLFAGLCTISLASIYPTCGSDVEHVGENPIRVWRLDTLSEVHEGDENGGRLFSRGDMDCRRLLHQQECDLFIWEVSSGGRVDDSERDEMEEAARSGVVSLAMQDGAIIARRADTDKYANVLPCPGSDSHRRARAEAATVAAATKLEAALEKARQQAKLGLYDVGLS